MAPVLDGPVLHQQPPGVQVRPVDLLVAFAHGQLCGQLLVFVPGHVVVGVGHAQPVKNIFVVEQYVIVVAERQPVQLAVHADVVQQPGKAADVHAALLDVAVQRLQLVAVDHGRERGDVLGHDDVDLLAAGQHDRQLIDVIGRGNVHHLHRVAGGGFVEVDHLLIIWVILKIPHRYPDGLPLPR